MIQLHAIGATSTQPELIDEELTESLRARTDRRVGRDTVDPRSTEPWLNDVGWFDYET